MSDRCAECGMIVDVNEYHPYPACVMFRQVADGDKVRAYLDQIIEYGKGESAKELATVTRALERSQTAEADCLRLSRELTAMTARRDALLSAVQEAVAVIDGNPDSIVDTIWVTGGSPETLRDRLQRALDERRQN